MNMSIVHKETNQTAQAAQQAMAMLQQPAIPKLLQGIAGLTKPAPKDKQ